MRPIVFTTTFLLAISLSGAASAQLMGYEDLARTTALTAADDYRIGKGYMDMVSWMYGESTDEESVARVEAMVRRLLAASDRPDMVFNVIVVPDPTVNAAALPGGFLMINQGLLDALSEDEVAFVIAHEISHVQLRHFATTMNMTAAMEVLSDGEAAHASGDGTGLGTAYEEMSRMATRYSRQLELEADLYGLLYSMRAGYPSQASVDAMESMKLSVGEIPEWMADDASHPTFSSRITELQAGTETVSETYALFDAGVAYARTGEYAAAIPAFEQFLTLFPKSAAAWSNLGTCHLHEAVKNRTDDPWHDDMPLYLKSDVTVRASAGIDRSQLERARAAFGKVLALDPNRDAALANLAVLARIEGDLAGSEALLKKALELDGDYAGYLNNMGNLFATKGDLKKADKWWGKAIKADDGALYAVANRARGYAERGKTRDAVSLYERLVAHKAYAGEAHTQLIALGARPAGSAAPEFPTDQKEEDSTLLVALIEATADDPGVGSPETEAPVEAPVEAPPEPTTAPVEKTDTGEPGSETKFGNVGLGESLAAMKKVFGEPDFEDHQDDDYYVYAGWWEAGVSATFTDDACSGLEIFPPGEVKTGRGVSIGSTEADVRAAYGEPTDTYGDRNAGYEAWTYDAIGTAFYLDGSDQVVSISMWSW